MRESGTFLAPTDLSQLESSTDVVLLIGTLASVYGLCTESNFDLVYPGPLTEVWYAQLAVVDRYGVS